MNSDLRIEFNIVVNFPNGDKVTHNFQTKDRADARFNAMKNHWEIRGGKIEYMKSYWSELGFHHRDLIYRTTY